MATMDAWWDDLFPFAWRFSRHVEKFFRFVELSTFLCIDYFVEVYYRGISIFEFLAIEHRMRFI